MDTSENKPRFKDAITMLVHDHDTVKAMFKKYEGLGENAYVGKKNLADEICSALSEHCVIEEEIFYPAVRRALKEGPPLVNEAVVEHAGAKELIAQLQAMSADDELFDAKVKVLSEQIDHHVKEEEGEMFPEARKSHLNLVDLRDQMIERKDQLSAEGI
ncbi:hemerythrin domain-containing protein [Glaciimonas sp. PAMC28666]|uniref:hemerythrin domain-containing protein n=1 Tax=Glaciimonas sp. PAMC28666 TaxID=2807626 RepID=UPI0019623CC7|nr:hemerythrin domain-containing protein [Glaciimonas sp. PAMC28666]QRX82424.1 hemerythrin domain-containing protein [Glaciimonas sp. PAMC28666]